VVPFYGDHGPLLTVHQDALLFVLVTSMASAMALSLTL
jgi:hypothetical protein